MTVLVAPEIVKRHAPYIQRYHITHRRKLNRTHIHAYRYHKEKRGGNRTRDAQWLIREGNWTREVMVKLKGWMMSETAQRSGSAMERKSTYTT